ncbi:AAA family ATPase [Hymenobacter sp. ASUV-10]|uniref:AAA family ATPase n=1 Tax=Hymenobacter aranciens TaxID=3063996 RepID=A0ABT9BH83_9BACT|nr:AAA family ATPase [Hymenobacter sp. ASUV-10]MDO7877622.1 AAA family ATPase [Hymenobacter sp. ASUV-10]
MAATTPDLRLTRLRISNLHSIGELDVPLWPLTVLVGPNGAGKSNVVDALRLLRDCLTRGLDQALLDRNGLNALRRWTPGGRPLDVSLGVTATIGDNPADFIAYDFTLAADPRLGHTVKREVLEVHAGNGPHYRINWQDGKAILKRNGKNHIADEQSGWRRLGTANLLLGPQVLHGELYAFPIAHTEMDEDSELPEFLFYSELARDFQQLVSNALFYALQPTQLRAPQQIVREVPFDEGGQNLAAVLRSLRHSRRSTAEVQATLRRLVSDITDFSVEIAGSYLVTYLHYKNAGGRIRKADLGSESDGTLRVLGILAALYQSDPTAQFSTALFGDGDYTYRRLLAIEEPEVNIHPGMLAVLAELFKEASQRRQVLLTTHSPELLDYLPPESFLVVEKEQGETRVGPLAEDQVETVRQQLFTAGELLRTEGLHRQLAPASPTAPTR